MNFNLPLFHSSIFLVLFHFFVQMQILVWYILSNWRTFFSIFPPRIYLPTLNSLCFFFPEKVFILPLFLKYIFSGVELRINSFSFYNLKVWLHCLLVSLVSVCCVCSLLPLAAFKIFSVLLVYFLCFVFSSVISYLKQDFLFYFDLYLSYLVFSELIGSMVSCLSLIFRILDWYYFKHFFFDITVVCILSIWYGLIALGCSVLYFFKNTLFPLCQLGYFLLIYLQVYWVFYTCVESTDEPLKYILHFYYGGFFSSNSMWFFSYTFHFSAEIPVKHLAILTSCVLLHLCEVSKHLYLLSPYQYCVSLNIGPVDSATSALWQVQTKLWTWS